ncbi:MAG: hypothetical protein CME38_18920 [Haliea sp.]|nr:hypothetical protein [Haliea sp.]|tara:strand:- start:2007 stop:2645 length:639 start_codon:yes stop_codon:yes gene_type:complete
MVDLEQLKAILHEAEQVRAEASKHADEAAEQVAVLLIEPSRPESWSRETRAALLETARVSGINGPQLESLEFWQRLEAEAADSVNTARQNLIAEASSLALSMLLELSAMQHTDNLVAVADRRREDLAPSPLSWVWFPGRGLWRWILRRWRSRQFALAAFALREHVGEVEEVLALLRTLTPGHKPPELDRLLAAADRYLSSHHTLLERIAHGH